MTRRETLLAMDLAQKQRRRGRRGYSLVELLVTVALLLLFTGLAVVSLNTLSQRSTLTEGAVRFETLLRFARAEAAHSGRRVRLNFVQDTNQVETALQLNTKQVDTTTPLNHVELTWEPDPVGEPDVFRNLLTMQWGVDQANEMVAVSAVRLVENAGPEPAAPQAGPPAADEASPGNVVPGPPPSITFNPSGSSDSAEITLADRAGKEARRIIVRLEGFTGCVGRVDPPDKDADAQETAEAQPPSDAPAPH